MCSTGAKWRRRAACAAWLWGAVLGLTLPASAQPDPVSVLHHEAGRLRAQAAALAEAEPASDAVVAGLRALAHAHQALADVGVTPDTSTVVAQAIARVEDTPAIPVVYAALREVADHLDAVAGIPTLHGTRAVPARDYAAAQVALETELSGGGYGAAGESVAARFWQTVRQAVGRFLERLFDTKAVTAIVNVSYYFMWTLLTAALILLAWLLVRRYGRRPGAPPASPETLVATRRMADPERYRVEAAGHAAAGRYRDAVRAGFLMVLAELEARDLVVFDRTRTNREYARQLQRRVGPGPLLQGFQELARMYGRTWYGRRPCDADAYTAFAGEATATVSLIEART